MNRKERCLPFSFLQMSLWGSYGIAYTYINRYLLNEGMSNAQIGLLLGAATAAGFFIQSCLAGKVDGVCLTARKILLCGGILQILTMTGLLLSRALWLTVLLYCISYTGLLIIPSFVNVFGVQSIKAGKRINLGISRGLGSVTFSLTCQLASQFIELGGYRTVPVFTILLSIAFTASLLLCPKIADQSAVPAEKTRGGVVDFFSKYPMFLLYVAALACCGISHSMLRNSMYQIALWKGDVAAQGIGLSLAAFTEIVPMFLYITLKRIRSNGFWMCFSSLFYLVRNLLILILPGVTGLYIAQLTQMLAAGISMVATVYFIAEQLPDAYLVRGQAYGGAASIIGSLIAYISSGFLLDRVSLPLLIGLGAVMALLGTILMFIAVHRCSAYSASAPSAASLCQR